MTTSNIIHTSLQPYIFPATPNFQQQGAVDPAPGSVKANHPSGTVLKSEKPPSGNECDCASTDLRPQGHPN